MLLVSGTDKHDDDFIEVHIYGPIVIEAIDRFVLPGNVKGKERVRLKQIAARAKEFVRSVDWR